MDEGFALLGSYRWKWPKGSHFWPLRATMDEEFTLLGGKRRKLPKGSHFWIPAGGSGQRVQTFGHHTVGMVKGFAVLGPYR